MPRSGLKVGDCVGAIDSQGAIDRPSADGKHPIFNSCRRSAVMRSGIKAPQSRGSRIAAGIVGRNAGKLKCDTRMGVHGSLAVNRSAVLRLSFISRMPLLGAGCHISNSAYSCVQMRAAQQMSRVSMVVMVGLR